MMEKKWEQIKEGTASKIAALAKSLNISPILASLLFNRGITNFEDAKTFFRPNLNQLHSPFLMKDMDAAVQILGSALEQGKRIRIYGDYDVDGTTSVAMLYGFLKKYEAKVDFYIPDRYREGYGISKIGVDQAIADGVDLFISIDCGIRAIETISSLKNAGISVIVCDHHMPGAALPPADAILNPKQKDCSYPYKELCGCGVGYKLLQGLTEQYNLEPEVLQSQLDLVALATAADIVPITGENRVFAFMGLKQINTAMRAGLKGMLFLAQKKEAITISDLVFTVAPRINAAGRIDHGREAVRLLTAEREDEVKDLAQNLQELNNERRVLDQEIAAAALEQIVHSGQEANKTTVVYEPSWHKGVVGIVASRLTETYYRPTVVLCESEGKISGSVRSVSGFDVYEALCDCEEHLEQFGGHKYAAGLTMQPEFLDAFKARFENAVATRITDELLVPKESFDAEINLSDITPKFYNILQQMAPFGPGNGKPKFLVKDVMDTGWAKVVGEKHLKMRVYQGQNPDISFGAIAFGLGDRKEWVAHKKPFQIIASVEENKWKGEVQLQLMVKDIKQIP